MSTKDIELSMKLAALAAAVDDILQEEYGARVGFALVVAPFNQENGTQVQYASNIDREQATSVLETILNRWKTGLPDVPHHVKH